MDINNCCTSNLSSFALPTPDEIKTIVMDAPPKSCNLDPVPTWQVKDTINKLLPTTSINKLLPTTSYIIVTSLQSSVMPEKYKTSYISPLLKKTGLNPESLLNYRTISNLPFISKIIERVVAKQLTVNLQENDLHDQFESAYRQDHSTETALIKVHDDIICAVNRGCVVVLVMLDLTAAYKTIEQTILLSRLFHRFGVTGAALEWFRSYLSGRTKSFGSEMKNHPQRM